MTWISPEVTPPLCVQSVDRMGRFSYGLPPVDYEMECGGCDRFLPSNNFHKLAKYCRQCESEVEGRDELRASNTNPGVRPSDMTGDNAAFEPFSRGATAPARIPPRHDTSNEPASVPKAAVLGQTQPPSKSSRYSTTGFEDYFGKLGDVQPPDITQPPCNPHDTLKETAEDSTKPSLQGPKGSQPYLTALPSTEQTQENDEHEPR